MDEEKTLNDQHYAVKVALYPNKEQERLIHMSFAFFVRVYNFCVQEFKNVWDNRDKEAKIDKDFKNSISRYTLAKRFRKEVFSLEENKWMKECSSHIIDQSCRAYQESLDNFFKWLFNPNKAGIRKCGEPSFQSLKYRRKSYRTDGITRVTGNKIQIPSLGKIRWRHKGLDIDMLECSTVAVSFDGKNYYASLTTHGEKELYEKTGKHAGIDLGIKTNVVVSDGTEMSRKMSLSMRRRLKRADRRLSRKQPKKGEKASKNYLKEKERHKRLYLKETHRREHFAHEVTSELVKKYDVISMEDLNVSGMLKNHRLARSVAESGFGRFGVLLEYKSQWRGRKVVKVGRFYPSSQRCSNCGFRHEGMKNLSKRTFVCPHCGHVMDRDLNASKNIDTLGCSEIGEWYKLSNASGEFIIIGQNPEQVSAPVTRKASRKGRKKEENCQIGSVCENKEDVNASGTNA